MRGLVVKAGRLNMSRQNCSLVLMRNMKRPSDQWEPVSTSGFRVVCFSVYDAQQLVWHLGNALNLKRAGEPLDDDHYLDWLLAHYFRIVPHVAGTGGPCGLGQMEVPFSWFLKGWYPNAEDIPGISPAGQLAGAALAHSIRGR